MGPGWVYEISKEDHMEIKAIKNFTDMKSGKSRWAGETYKYDEQRAQELIAQGVAEALVCSETDEKPKTKKSSAKK